MTMQEADDECDQLAEWDGVFKQDQNKDRTPTGSTTSFQPWASGRILTEAQRARKRQVDKHSSRKRRRYMKEHISQLEQEVENFLHNPQNASHLGQSLPSSRTDGFGSQEHISVANSSPRASERSWSIPISVSQVNEGDSTIFPALHTGNTPAREHDHHDGSISLLSLTPTAPLSGFELTETTPYFEYLPESWSAAPDVLLPQVLDDTQPSSVLPELATDETLPAKIEIVSNEPPLTALAAANHGSIAIFRSFNKLLHQAHRLRPSQVCLDDELNQHALISAVVRGWDTLGQGGRMCPLWNVLRHIDNQVFCVASVTTRLSMLRMIHFMLMCQTKAESYRDLPPWYRPRPTQRKFRHEVVKGYFAWPSLRERLILSDETILTDSFFDKFARSFRLHWPNNDQDTYKYDPTTEMFRFSGRFLNYLFDINKWRMDNAFFTAYPDIYEDIEPAEQVIPVVNLAASRASAPRLLCTAPASHESNDEEAREPAHSSAQSSPRPIAPFFDPGTSQGLKHTYLGLYLSPVEARSEYGSSFDDADGLYRPYAGYDAADFATSFCSRDHTWTAGKEGWAG